MGGQRPSFADQTPSVYVQLYVEACRHRFEGLPPCGLKLNRLQGNARCRGRGQLQLPHDQYDALPDLVQEEHCPPVEQKSSDPNKINLPVVNGMPMMRHDKH